MLIKKIFVKTHSNFHVLKKKKIKNFLFPILNKPHMKSPAPFGCSGTLQVCSPLWLRSSSKGCDSPDQKAFLGSRSGGWRRPLAPSPPLGASPQAIGGEPAGHWGRASRRSLCTPKDPLSPYGGERGEHSKGIFGAKERGRSRSRPKAERGEGGQQFEIKKQFLQNFEKSNQNTYCLQRPLSYISEWIQKGDLLSDCSASDKGELALGKNLFVGYMSWEGLNFEDAVLINEQILSKYMSLHIEKYEIEICEGSEKILTSKSKSNSNNHKFSTELASRALELEGVPKIGTWIQEGEFLIGKLAPPKGEPSILLTHEKLLYDIVGEKKFSFENKYFQVPSSGRIIRICYTHASPPERSEAARRQLARPKPFWRPTDLAPVGGEQPLSPGESQTFVALSEAEVPLSPYGGERILRGERATGRWPSRPSAEPEVPEGSETSGCAPIGFALPIKVAEGSAARPRRGRAKRSRRLASGQVGEQTFTDPGIKSFNIFPLVCSPKIAAAPEIPLPICLSPSKVAYPPPQKGFFRPGSSGRARRPTGARGRESETNFLHSLKTITIYIAEKRVFKIGDKISGRHGNKGIISQILSKYDMPYLPNGFPLDVLLNPLGVPSRMNVGQIFECLLGFVGQIFQTSFQVLCFDEIYGYEASRSLIYSKLFESCKKTKQKWLLSKERPGKLHLFDGRTGELFNQSILVGSTYLMKLIHIVDEKIHARATGPYSLITQQPLRGRAKHGGQRLGEMEIWALQGFGIAYAIQELLTVKSDDLQGRNKIMQTLLKNTPFKFGTPESLRVVLRELQCLCLQLEISK